MFQIEEIKIAGIVIPSELLQPLQRELFELAAHKRLIGLLFPLIFFSLLFLLLCTLLGILLGQQVVQQLLQGWSQTANELIDFLLYLCVALVVLIQPTE